MELLVATIQSVNPLLAVSLALGFAGLGGLAWWITRVESELGAHEAACTRRYETIFSLLKDIQDTNAEQSATLARLDERSKHHGNQS